MKIGIPVVEDKGKDSEVAEHFGRAKYYLIYDSEEDELNSVECESHPEGTCLPIELLAEESVDAIYAFAMGQRALEMLKRRDIEAKTGKFKTVKEVIEGMSSLDDLESSCR
ncbi:MAG: NifB/NifX family molybdenum-iron cluster-binding protein [Candidatus Aenigmatarchaeota archaeon]